jgi:hypothetical protein
MATLSARPPREDPHELAREYLGVAKRGNGERHALRDRLLAAAERDETLPAALDPSPGPPLEAARWFRDPAEMAREYRAFVRGESLFLRCHRPLPAGAWITFSFREGPHRRLEVVVVGRAPGVMEVQPFRPDGGGLEGFLDAVAVALAQRILAPAPGAIGRKRR